MNRPLLWKLCTTIAFGTVALFWLLGYLMDHTEHSMSFIATEHRQTLLDYGAEAERLYLAGDQQALATWLEQLQQRENTWAAVVRSRLEPVAGTIGRRFWEGFGLGRSVEWKIHLYFAENPIMEVPFADRHVHFLIQLPQRMRPGGYQPHTRMLLQIALPLLLLVLLSLVLYRHLMSPLRQLERATRRFSEGDHKVRVRAFLGSRNDELAGLADTFDHMAERTEGLIQSQRHLIADLSHELRPPLTRIEMAVDWAERAADKTEALARIRRDGELMRRLAEDTLTLAWLENERPRLNGDDLDLTDLLDSLLDDARFEFPHHGISAQLPAEAPLRHSSQRALGQAIENMLRNALHHTPPGRQVAVLLQPHDEGYRLDIDDQGPGVPESHLDTIFQPFFRLDGARQGQAGGFGLGLALARRQLEAAGGRVKAGNRAEGGLRMSIWLPLNGAD
ncbi:sensor histidine kinase [Zobellella iuensis]|uniref:histidine kinase n=1 Tax=Zobellella iuensis TaxID=2803811 RepID=A0ABS1QW58_9GAMM|nr:sensor histidine kinase [Zobellella iuensis]MBL1379084.1 sensor histidine kinase [Zobellella iuensis]